MAVLIISSAKRVFGRLFLFVHSLPKCKFKFFPSQLNAFTFIAVYGLLSFAITVLVLAACHN